MCGRNSVLSLSQCCSRAGFQSEARKSLQEPARPKRTSVWNTPEEDSAPALPARQKRTSVWNTPDDDSAPAPGPGQSSKSTTEPSFKKSERHSLNISARQVAPVNARRVSALVKDPPSRLEQACASFKYFLKSVLDPTFDAQNLAKGVELPGTPKGFDRLGAPCPRPHHPPPWPPAAPRAMPLDRCFTRRASLLPRCAVIHPGNRLVSFFDLLVAGCVLYSAIVAPIKVAYSANFLDSLDTFFDVMFSMGAPPRPRQPFPHSVLHAPGTPRPVLSSPLLVDSHWLLQTSRSNSRTATMRADIPSSHCAEWRCGMRPRGFLSTWSQCCRGNTWTTTLPFSRS